MMQASTATHNVRKGGGLLPIPTFLLLIKIKSSSLGAETVSLTSILY